ncbi:gamma-glutamyl-gamma-aminobutyrate hydrolase family protein [Nonomuraea sp. SMC257]|uniref:Gamma-glutamyl-gamma-aminobutyrate hydrolase family protein n=1 Tax=Nonomuraea montanisoli TaxID=2741721 RepID=A0A7Y6M927_9ACTN|nr:gamma-glutamyl-gamma-aminobutyrate hydrolase family protein [Nonomuraea montanisoli]NUW38161.1 gamma-glutamyl-gamma-aminobutyrate hydrolase family protein [Nonomuraea montanisoli]
MSRPLIGITTYVEPARYTVWELDAALLPFMYVEQVVRAGGQPVLLPPAGEPGPVAARLDGLILAGGGDIDPAHYQQEPHERVSYVRGFRDDAEFALLAAALERELPYLGVCRGLQVLNVALDGSLHQHLPDVVGHTEHSPGPGVFGHLPVRPVPGSRLAKALGTDPVEVPHYHHQAVDRLGLGLSVTATAADGTVEAVELDDHPFAVAVQWHPEAEADCALFEALVAAC